MPGWNGTGEFVRVYSWTDDAAAGIKIIASRMDADTNNITNNGFGNTLTRDGQGSATNDLPMNNFRHTGVGNASTRDEYAVVGQVQDSSYDFAIAGGTADAITASFSPAITALVDGMTLYVRASATNATTAPTFKVNALAAHTITKFGGQALVAGDIPGAGAELILRYVLAATKWELLNPAYAATLAVPWAVAAGTADAITAAYSPAIGALTDGLLLSFRATATNATTTPTFSPNGLTAHPITKKGGSALASGDIPDNLAEVFVRYNLANTRWELINPTNVPTYNSQLITANGTFTIPANCGISTVFKFTGTGAGGGSGGVSTSSGSASSGAGAGATFIAAFSGFATAGVVTVAIGAKGAKGAAGANGTTGGDTTLTYSAVIIATAHGGLLSAGVTSSANGSFCGSQGGAAVVPGGGGLTLLSSILMNGGDGFMGVSNATATLAFGGNGGTSHWGPGSRGVGNDGAAVSAAVNYGSAGGGVIRQGGVDLAGADGAPGVVLVEWWT